MIPTIFHNLKDTVTEMEKHMSKTLYLFADVETTGENFDRPYRNHRENQMLQLAYQLWNRDLSGKLSQGDFIVKLDDPHNAVNSMNEYVKNMHTETGLIERLFDVNQTTNIKDIDETLSNQLKPYVEKGYRVILTGNNVQFDFENMRRYLPETIQYVHYALLDVSSIRRMFDILGSDFGKQTKQNKASNHDAQVDIEECRKELTIYLDVLKNGLAPK